MKYQKLKNKIIQLFGILLLIGMVSMANAQTAAKKIATWYVYEDGKSSFEDLEPYKDIIASISVFGNLPKSFIDECHANKIEVYHAVSDGEKAIDSPEKISALTDKYLDICNSLGYDGIDLDFEALDPQIRDTYSVFLKEVSGKLHQAGKKLSQCVGFYNSLYQRRPDQMFYDVEVVASTCDLVRVMCYDMYFAPGRGDKALLNRVDCQGIGATSHYPFVKEAMLFWSNYVPKDKLVMGLPAYSNDYCVAGEGSGTQVYSSVPGQVKGTLTSPIWLWFEKINMYVYTGTDNQSHVFYASDTKSTQALLNLANELKINNIGFWHFSTVSSGMWQVTQNWLKE